MSHLDRLFPEEPLWDKNMRRTRRLRWKHQGPALALGAVYLAVVIWAMVR